MHIVILRYRLVAYPLHTLLLLFIDSGAYPYNIHCSWDIEIHTNNKNLYTCSHRIFLLYEYYQEYILLVLWLGLNRINECHYDSIPSPEKRKE